MGNMETMGLKMPPVEVQIKVQRCGFKNAVGGCAKILSYIWVKIKADMTNRKI